MLERRILIIEDDDFQKELLKVILAADDYQLEFASCGEEGVNLAEHLLPDLILLDVLLPDILGFEVCRRIRGIPLTAEIPILMITELNDKASRLMGLDAGSDDFISKPYDPIELRTRMKTILRLDRYRRLRLQRERFEQWVALSPDGIVVVDQNNIVLYTNTIAQQLFEIRVGCDFHRYLTLHTQSILVGTNGGAIFLSGIPFELKLRIRGEQEYNLEVRWMETEWGNQSAYLISLRDVTENRQFLVNFEQADPFLHRTVVDGENAHLPEKNYLETIDRQVMELSSRMSDEILREVFNLLSDLVFIMDEDGQYVDVFTGDESLLMNPRESLVGSNVIDRVPPGVAAKFLDGIQETIKTGRSVTIEYFLDISQKRTWFEGKSNLLKVAYNKKRNILWIIRNVTEKRNTADILQLQSAALNSADNSIVITDNEGAIEWANPAFEKLTGYSIEESLGKNPSILRSGLHQKEFYKNLWETILSGQVWQGEIINRKKDGELYYEEMTITPVINKWGVITHFIAIKQNISQRVLTEKALRKSEESFRKLITSTGVGVAIVDCEGYISFSNPAAEEVFGTQVGGLYGMRIEDFASPEDVTELKEQLKKRSQGEESSYEIEITRTDKGHRNLLITGTPRFEDNEWIGSFVFLRDITEQKAMEGQLLEAQKLAGIGTLAAGVAHEINSPLQVITGTSQSVLRQLDLDRKVNFDRLYRQMERINRSGWRVAEIVRSLQTYALGSEGSFTLESLNSILYDSQLLVENQFKTQSNLDIILDLDQTLPHFLCDRSQIAQVIFALLSNSRDAMPEGGVIILRTRYEPQEDTLILQVQDHGRGIDEQIRTKIFDPFYTTKPVGQGIGLGLATVSGIVRTHQGSIHIDSSVGTGTTFTIRFPREKNIRKKTTNYEKPAMVEGRFDK